MTSGSWAVREDPVVWTFYASSGDGSGTRSRRHVSLTRDIILVGFAIPGLPSRPEQRGSQYPYEWPCQAWSSLHRLPRGSFGRRDYFAFSRLSRLGQSQHLLTSSFGVSDGPKACCRHWEDDCWPEYQSSGLEKDNYWPSPSGPGMPRSRAVVHTTTTRMSTNPFGSWSH
jgi:hypothetical protein